MCVRARARARVFICISALGEKQSGVEMREQKKRAAGLGDGTVCGGEEMSLNEGAHANGTLFRFCL